MYADAAIGLSSTISSQISDLVPSSTMRDYSTMGFSSVTEPSPTMGLSSISGLSSTSGLSSVLGIFTIGYSSTLVPSSVGLPESNPTDPSSPGLYYDPLTLIQIISTIQLKDTQLHVHVHLG